MSLECQGHATGQCTFSTLRQIFFFSCALLSHATCHEHLMLKGSGAPGLNAGAGGLLARKAICGIFALEASWVMSSPGFSSARFSVSTGLLLPCLFLGKSKIFIPGFFLWVVRDCVHASACLSHLGSFTAGGHRTAACSSASEIPL